MSTPRLFDVHTHTQFIAFREDQDEVIQRALDAGVWMVNVGTQADTSAAAVQTAHRFKEGVYATIGLHPIHTAKSYHDAQELGSDDKGFTSRGEPFDYAYYKNLAGDEKVVALGECGLDYYRLESDTKEKQKEVFERHIELSQETKKPLMIHCRHAFEDLITIAQSSKSALRAPPGLVHFFSGTKENARALLDLGFSFSFGGVITFTRDYDEVVRYVPLERMVLETDAPYVTPVPYRGKRNEPRYVEEVAKKIATLKENTCEAIAEATTKNARELFRV